MELLKLSVEDMTAVISLANPPANAISTKVLSELSALLDKVEFDEEIRVVLICGEGRFFSAGADIKEFTTLSRAEEFSRLGKIGQDLFERIENFSKPIIAAIHGAALGGGLELAMACHFRVVSSDAKLGLPELQLGIIPGFAGTQRLPRLVGTARATEMLLTSSPITGEEAVTLGLVNHCYPENELMQNAKNIAAEISKKSPLSVKAVLELLRYGKTEKFFDGVNREAELFGQAFLTEDGKEGIEAFLNKRRPSFSGK